MIVQSPVLNVEAYVRSRIQHYIEELSYLCSIDSGSYHKFGLDEMARYLAVRMDELGMCTTIIEHEEWGNDVLGVIKGNGSGKVLLLGHTDTVYPVGTAANRPLRVEGDTLYGPGVCDMKGCILTAIYAIEALINLNHRSFGEIRFLCVSDEETNERHSKELIQQTSEGCHGVLVLEAARANGKLVSSRRGAAWYKLVARGHSAHAGVEPEKGRSAILEIAHQAIQFQSLTGWHEGVNVNVGVISGGTVANVVPDYAEAMIDLRFLNNTDKYETQNLWRKMLQRQLIPDVELTLEELPDYREPMTCSAESLKLAQQAQEIASLLGFFVDHGPTGGTSDANYVCSYGLPVLDGLGPVGGLDHSPNEYLMLDSIAPRTALLTGLIGSLGSKKA